MIITTINTVGVGLCIYTLVSKKYKTDDKRVALLFVCLNVIFMGRLWVVLDPTFTSTTGYLLVNLIAMLSLLLIMSLVKKNVVLEKLCIQTRVIKLFAPLKNKILKVISYFKKA